MPVILQPDPPLPPNVAIASAAVGTEARIALIRYLRLHPGPQRAAVEALTMAKQTASRTTRLLVEAGVVEGDPAPAGQRPGRWIVNEDRLSELLHALRDYTHGKDV